MQLIYDLIQDNPKLYAWVFSIVNVLWGLFIYFNKQRQDRSFKQLEQDLRFRADRRLKIFDLKASEYSKYVTDLDSFGKKNQLGIPARMQPIFDKYFKDYLAASESGDLEQERKIIGWLSSQISIVMREGLEDVLKLNYESNRLKLIATEEMLQTFEIIENLTQETIDCSNEYIGNFTEIIINKQHDKTEVFQIKVGKLSEDVQKNSKALLNQMRQELSDI
tara:strand:+ start:67 stop:729 length:663 start_codon:yes stop_codon:yes gene_type:complete